MRELAEGLRSLKLATTIVINQAPVQRQGREPALMQEAIDILIQYGIPVAPIGVRSRIIYQVAMINGMSAVEVMTTGPAAAECKTLWEHITQRLGIEKNQFSRPRAKMVQTIPVAKEMPQTPVNGTSQPLAQASR
jgi:hypothetical protein